MTFLSAFPLPVVGYDELGAALNLPASTLRVVQSAGMLPIRSTVRAGSRCFDSRDVALLANIRGGVDSIGEGMK